MVLAIGVSRVGTIAGLDYLDHPSCLIQCTYSWFWCLGEYFSRLVSQAFLM